MKCPVTIGAGVVAVVVRGLGLLSVPGRPQQIGVVVFPQLNTQSADTVVLPWSSVGTHLQVAMAQVEDAGQACGLKTLHWGWR